jgi:hypothetical protein
MIFQLRKEGWGISNEQKAPAAMDAADGIVPVSVDGLFNENRHFESARSRGTEAV